MPLVNPRAFCMGMGGEGLFSCQGATLPISKNSSQGAEFPGGQALAEMSTTPVPISE